MNTQRMITGVLSLVAVVATTVTADVYTGNMVKNPFMTDNKDDWTTTTPWRPNGAANLVHDFKTDGTAGFASAIAATRDLTLDVDITTDANYDANTTKLTDLSFGNVWVLIPNWNTDKIGANMSGNFYCEVEIATLSGNTYRGSSNKLTVDTSTTAGGYGQVFTLNGWASYGDWDGNPLMPATALPWVISTPLTTSGLCRRLPPTRTERARSSSKRTTQA